MLLLLLLYSLGIVKVLKLIQFHSVHIVRSRSHYFSIRLHFFSKRKNIPKIWLCKIICIVNPIEFVPILPKTRATHRDHVLRHTFSLSLIFSLSSSLPLCISLCVWVSVCSAFRPKSRHIEIDIWSTAMITYINCYARIHRTTPKKFTWLWSNVILKFRLPAIQHQPLTRPTTTTIQTNRISEYRITVSVSQQYLDRQ